MVSSKLFTGDGTTKIFPIDFLIQGEAYVQIWLDDVAVDDRSTYDIINNSIVFLDDYIPDNLVVIEIAVASTAQEIADLNAPPSGIVAVANNIAAINSVASTVVPNISEILLADDNAIVATAKASEASASATSASNSANSATASALSASNYATTASTKASEASASATTAEDAKIAAGLSETNAEQYAIAAEASADRAESFDPLTYRTDTPTLSGASTVTELNDLLVTITNYDADSDYEVSTTNGTVVRVGDTITVTTTSVTEDTSSTLNVTALKNGYLLSATASFNFTVLNMPIQNDTDAYIDVTGTDFNSTNFPTVVNGNVDNDYLIATADNCEATSSIVAKADSDGDWNGVQDTSYVTSELNNVLSSADATDVVVQGEVLDGDVLYVGDSTNFAEVTASGAEYIGVNDIDPFGDNSDIELFTFDDTIVGLNGNALTSFTPNYTLGKHGKAVVVTTTQYANTGIDSTAFSQYTLVSYWAKRNGTPTNSYHTSVCTSNTLSDFFGIADTGVSFGVGQGDSLGFTSQPIANWDDGEYHHFTVVYNSTTKAWTTYFDGCVIDVSVVNDRGSLATTNIRLFRSIYGVYHNANMNIDQMIILSRATDFTAQEVASIFNAGKTKLPHTQAYTPTFACNKDNVSMELTFNGGSNYEVLAKDSGELVSYNDPSDTDPLGDSSLIAMYELDGDVNDSLGSYNGVANDVTYESGKFGQAGVFNGLTSNIATGYISSASDFSISMWCKLTNDGNSHYLLSFYSGTGSSSTIFSALSTGEFRINSKNVDAKNFGTVLFDTWQHCTMLYSNSSTSFTMYIDGIEVATSASTIASGYELDIGNPLASNVVGVNGLIDQVQIFNRVLTPTEVTRLYETGKRTIKENYQAQTLVNQGQSLGFKIKHKEEGTKTTEIFIELTETGA